MGRGGVVVAALAEELGGSRVRRQGVVGEGSPQRLLMLHARICDSGKHIVGHIHRARPCEVKSVSISGERNL